MFGGISYRLGSIWFGQISSIHNAQRFMEMEMEMESESGRFEDRISALPDDLLAKILSYLPTENAVSTMILSKRWRSIWMILPQLEYMDMNYEQEKKKSIWCFLDKSLQLHKASVLESLIIELSPRCPFDADVGKWIAYAVDCKVRHLQFKLSWLTKLAILPNSPCDTLVRLVISDKILVVPPPLVCLPSLRDLYLISVVYKNEDSLVRFLSGCHVLKNLYVERHDRDKLTNFIVKVPSLKTLSYTHPVARKTKGSLVIEAASLRKIFLKDNSGNSCSMENVSRFDNALINIYCNLDDNFMRSLSSVMYLNLILNLKTVVSCKAINFSHLIECTICLSMVTWLKPFMHLLQNSPKLKVLRINKLNEDFLHSFNPPSCVPECLSTHLEIFEWKGYQGRNGEKEVVSYILANSNCLRRAIISIKQTISGGVKKKLMKLKLESMYRVSTSSQLMFSPQLEYVVYFEDELSD